MKYVLLSLLTFLIGYLFLRTGYYASVKNPYAQEMILIVLGTIATILITAALLNKQTELELSKEYGVKLFELKSQIYLDLINFLEKIVVDENLTKKDLVTLEFLSHKISLVGSPQVLQEYSNFIDIIKNAVQDYKISETDFDKISAALANLSFKIRYDLIQKESNETLNIENIIKKNISKF